jgi:hypothetical protein
VVQEVPGQARVEWVLDPIQRRSSYTESAWVNAAWAASVTKVSHYATDSDEPAWFLEDSTLPTDVTRYVSGVEGDLAVSTALDGGRDNGTLAPIETLDTGDLVLTGDPETGEVSAQPVITPITGTGTKHLVEVVTDAGTWTATANHPIWVEGKGVGSTGGILVVQAMHDLGWLAGQTVHNLSIAGTHTYYIATPDGNLDALVHNCPAINAARQNRHIRGTVEYANAVPARSYFASATIAARATQMAIRRGTQQSIRGGTRIVWDAGVTVGWSSTGQRLTSVSVQLSRRGAHAWPH